MRAQDKDADALTQELVHAALDRAVDGGHGQFASEADPIVVAADLARCDTDLELFNAEDLLPHVLSWRAARPLPRAEAPPLVPE